MFDDLFERGKGWEGEMRCGMIVCEEEVGYFVVECKRESQTWDKKSWKRQEGKGRYMMDGWLFQDGGGEHIGSQSGK